jgi:hypothetical protein
LLKNGSGGALDLSGVKDVFAVALARNLIARIFVGAQQENAHAEKLDFILSVDQAMLPRIGRGINFKAGT